MHCKDNGIFNLMDTNGRRDDVVEALNGYLQILDEMSKDEDFLWKSIGGKRQNSLSQYLFFERAIEMSSDVFETHSGYDYVKEQLNNNHDLKNAIDNRDLVWLKEHIVEYPDILKKIDIGMEARARFFTNTLVKLGFVNDERRITAAGKMLLDCQRIKKDQIETLFPLGKSNIAYLRQLLKLRVYSKDKRRYYSPFCMAILALLRKERIDSGLFFEMIQGITPNMKRDWQKYIDEYYFGKCWEEIEIDIPQEINDSRQIDEKTFKANFTNGKSSKVKEVYWEFYKKIYAFNVKRDRATLKELVDFYMDSTNKKKVDKAFGGGKPLFALKRGQYPSIKEFLKKDNAKIFGKGINSKIYRLFYISKEKDEIREKSDTTRRIFKATGLIKFDNGYVELAYKELCKYVFAEDKIASMCSGCIPQNVELNYLKYEGDEYSLFCNVFSTKDILHYSKREYDQILKDVINEFKGEKIEDIPGILLKRRVKEFNTFIEDKYPEDKTKDLLKLFSDRNNDAKIRKIVNPDASVPTIYEYLVGIAWYYFSGKKIDLLNSFNLNLSANFEPISFAPGGAGDIVINGKDSVIMLEVTLMNKNAQKRGEWEPVLRHSVNLKAEEEKKDNPRDVTTFFVADSFDNNTINIWKAIASVPLESSSDRRITDNVIIMPISTEELIKLLENKTQYTLIIQQIRDYFNKDKMVFDTNWRNKLIKQIS